jgi:conserved hypothetical protein
MSFTLDIKAELARIETKALCCELAECYGIWLFSKCFRLQETGYSLESGEAVRKSADLAARVCGISPEIRYRVSRRKNPAYRIRIPDEQDRHRLLNRFGYSGRELPLRMQEKWFECPDCRGAFLRGAFLTCGMAANPNSSYHLEFATQYRQLTEDLQHLMAGIEGLDLHPQIGERKGNRYLYLKDSAQCERMLVFIGAANGAMQMMQVKMYKEEKNYINRKTNFETANMDKTYSASVRQIIAIQRIQEAGKLAQLPEDQRKIAQLRLDNPEMTLREFAEILGCSRSRINYRFNKILAFAEKLET